MTAHAVSRPGQRLTGAHVPEARRGAVGSMPIVTSHPCAATSRGLADAGRERLLVGDDVVGGEGADQGVRVLTLEQGRGQADGGHRVAGRRLGDHAVDRGQLTAYRLARARCR